MIFKERLFSYVFNDFQRWPLWFPVFLGVGIALYFSLPFEPAKEWAYGGISLFCLSLWRLRLSPFRFFILSLSLVALGFSAALLRTHFLHTDMLHYSLPPLTLTGTVSQLELKPTKTGTFFQRLILTDLKADTTFPLSQKVRLTLKGKRERLWPGQVIRVTAKLSPLTDPGLPGGFDFRRQAYFQGIGATGFILSIPEILGDASSWSTRLEKRREEITAFFLTHLSSPEGAIAAALITGDKAAIPEEVREDFINSGLAHILAISGLHLTIIAGVVFMIIRRGVALIPSLCLSYNSKKIAALGTIFMTFLYLVLSGFGIPAQRAFIMISLVMGAILIDRTALSMRTVAVAAFFILLITPEALLGPSFQLSFAAVIGLIAGYETWRNPLSAWVVRGGIFRKFLLYGGGLAFTSFLATLATLPFTIYLFHRFSLHAVEANLVAVPLTSLVIMPFAFLSCLLSPLGLGEGPLFIFEKSITLLVKIASTVSAWSGTNIPVAHPPLFSFVFIVGGGLWLCLWQQPWRKWGIFPIFLGFLAAFWGDPPHLLIDGRGKLVALYDNNVLHLNSLRKGKFVADVWKKHLAAQEIKPLTCKEGVCEAAFQDIPIVISSVKENQPCVKGAILIRLEPSQKACPDAYHTLDWYDLWRGGSHALWLTPHGLRLEKVRPSRHHRPWQRRPISRKAPVVR
ncbi:MAG: ComEC family competence protein [Proteobacteria bacterium]|nr:ComEC family competence protein [Pseudomonadota bacterium]